MPTHKIAVLAGDGIGREVMPEGVRAVEAAARKHGIDCAFTSFDWAHTDYYMAHGAIGPRTPDVGGTASTDEVGRAIASAI